MNPNLRKTAYVGIAFAIVSPGFDHNTSTDREIAQFVTAPATTTTSASVAFYNTQPFGLPGEEKLTAEAPAIAYAGELSILKR